MSWLCAGAAAVAPAGQPASPGTPSRSGAADTATKTRAIFYTESDYNPSQGGWTGRLSVLRAATPESPRWVADATNPTGVAVDSLRGRVYWTDPGDASIHTCLADGTEHALVAAGTFGHRMNDGPFGIAVDEQSEVSELNRAGRCSPTKPLPEFRRLAQLPRPPLRLLLWPIAPATRQRVLQSCSLKVSEGSLQPHRPPTAPRR
jgi:hypothetical protein